MVDCYATICWLNQLSNQAHVSKNLLHFDFYQKHFSCELIHMLNTESHVFFKFVSSAKNSRNSLMRDIT